jgi:hypothetical protein
MHTRHIRSALTTLVAVCVLAPSIASAQVTLEPTTGWTDCADEEIFFADACRDRSWLEPRFGLLQSNMIEEGAPDGVDAFLGSRRMKGSEDLLVVDGQTTSWISPIRVLGDGEEFDDGGERFEDDLPGSHNPFGGDMGESFESTARPMIDVGRFLANLPKLGVAELPPGPTTFGGIDPNAVMGGYLVSRRVVVVDDLDGDGIPDENGDGIFQPDDVEQGGTDSIIIEYRLSLEGAAGPELVEIQRLSFDSATEFPACAGGPCTIAGLPQASVANGCVQENAKMVAAVAAYYAACASMNPGLITAAAAGVVAAYQTLLDCLGI